MKKLIAPLSAAGFVLVAFLISFTGTAYASQAVAPEDGSLIDLARPIFDQIMAGHWLAAAALALVFCVAIVKRYAPGKFGELVHSDPGGALTTLLMAFGGALATATMGGAPWSWKMLWTALTVAVTAAGGYSLIKKLIIEPILKPLAEKGPLWLKPILMVVLWVFDKRDNAATANATAAAAGDAAVAATPSTGTDGVVGEAKDL